MLHRGNSARPSIGHLTHPGPSAVCYLDVDRQGRVDLHVLFDTTRSKSAVNRHLRQNQDHIEPKMNMRLTESNVMH